MPAWSPPQPRRSPLWPALITLLALSFVLALGGTAAAYLTSRPTTDAAPVASTWVDLRPEVGGKAIEALLDRHAKAVQDKNLEAWMADVDQSDPAFVKRQQQLFENLGKMSFEELRFERTEVAARKLAKFMPTQLFDRYHAAVRVEPVTVRHRIKGIDSKSVATPWLPVLAWTGGRWVIVGEGTGSDLPLGTSGQPWDSAGPVTVVRSNRVVAVVSGDDNARGQSLVQLAETSLKQVTEVRPAGWDGKVLFTAVQDERIFEAYFSESQERIARVAAIAVPFYSQVGDWATAPVYGTTRIVFNPQQLTAAKEELAHDLTHEFAHAAMGPVTTSRTPRWVVEGFAEYVAYRNQNVPAAGIRQILGDLTVTTLPADDEFYKEPRNYVASWLACRMIAEKYGQDKLIAFYESFQRLSEVESAAKEVLGVDKATIEQQWRDYVAQKKAA